MLKYRITFIIILFINFIIFSGPLSEYRSIKRDVRTSNEIINKFGVIFILLVVIILIFAPVVYLFNKRSKKKRLEFEQVLTKSRQESIEKFKTIFQNEGLLVTNLEEVSLLYSLSVENNKKFEYHLDDFLEVQREIKKRKEFLCSKYGEEKGIQIFEKRFFIGMTKEELKDCFDCEPDKIEIDQMKTKTKETWIYGNKSSGDVFVFENETLTRFKDR